MGTRSQTQSIVVHVGHIFGGLGLCEVHGVAGVMSSGSITSLGPRQGPQLLNTDQLQRVRQKLEEQRLQQFRDQRRVRRVKDEVSETSQLEPTEEHETINDSYDYLTRPKYGHGIKMFNHGDMINLQAFS